LRLALRNALLVAGALLTVTFDACRSDDQQASEPGERHAFPEPVRVGSFAIDEGALYRVEGETLQVLAVLPGAGTAKDTLDECAAVIPELGGARFRNLTLSPDSTWAAWETTGPGACVGVVGPSQPPVRVLGKWSAAALPDSVLWAPAGRYLAVWLEHPGRRRSLWVFDAVEGERLEMPWEVDCTYVEDCDVERVVWLGGTLLNVGIRLGPAEQSVPFEVNVEATPLAGTGEES